MTVCAAPCRELDILRHYVIEELGGVFLYIPSWLHMQSEAVTPADRKVRACLDELFEKRVVRGGPWPMRLRYVSEQNKELLPALFNGRVQAFELYRIDRGYWQKLLDR